MERREQLFSGFSPISKEQWKVRAIEDLKGADFERKLVWKTDDGFSVVPFYTPDDVEQNDALQAQDRLCARTHRVWVRYAAVSVEDNHVANQQALSLVKGGATGLLFTIPDPGEVDFVVLLRGLNPAELCLSFTTPQPSMALVSEYLTYLYDQDVKLDAIKGFYASDILERWITTGEEPDFETVANLLRLASEAPHFKCLVVQSHAFIDAGGSTTQELAFTFNKVTDYLDQLTELGISQDLITANLVLHMAIGGDYFFEVAKLRAVRVLLKSVLDLYGSDADGIPLLASNALWSKSVYDPYVNLLRNTTEAMSAVLGGCDALLVQPHDASLAASSPFSQHLALNVSNLLKEEAYFDKVVDPAAGCYYIESLTALVAHRALAVFKEIEALGGFMLAFRQGVVQEKIKLLRETKDAEIATRKRVYVGTNKYPNLQEQALLIPPIERQEASAGFPLLVPRRATRNFDEVRRRTLAHRQATGQVPRVYLATFGHPAASRARAQFASEFFGAAGFQIMGEFFNDSPVKGAEESAASQADIVVICASDADYQVSAVAFATAFKKQAGNKMLVLAGYPDALIPLLNEAGVDTFIHVKTNAIEVLTQLQNQLFAATTEAVPA